MPGLTSSAPRTPPRPLVVYAWLAGLTVVELGVAALGLPRLETVALLVASALAKAAFVVVGFMHLGFEGRLVRWIAVGTIALLVVFTAALVPDIGLGPRS